ncbi:MAG: nuclear transport factor 2 family protein [Novosphingobium sp.]|nr:nuclear transport factor 2 family protein [Novosphingobium sp.]
MSSAADTVKTFLAMWETPGGIEKALRTYFAPSSTWENVGMSTTTGPDEAMAIMDGFSAALGMKTMWVENLHVAAVGDTVLTERIDHVRDGEGKTLMSIRVMGAFDVKDGKIMAWRDYFDTAGFASGS